MKKILPVFLLSLSVILVSCSQQSNLCSFAGTSNSVYYVFYPDGSYVSGMTDANGYYHAYNKGYTCNQLHGSTGVNFNFALTANPASVYLPSPPTSGTITGQGFDATYGMPSVDYFDSNGYLIGSVYATSVSSDGTSLQANLPDLSSVYSGTYQVRVVNKTYNGYYMNLVGSATMSGSGRDRLDSDGDGWYDDEDCAPYDPSLNYSCVDTCGGDGTTPYTICEPMY